MIKIANLLEGQKNSSLVSVCLDYRSLSLFRVLLGCLGVFRFGMALKWSGEFFSKNGFLPIEASSIYVSRWSLFLVNHTLEWAQLLCFLGLVLSFFLIIGFRTRAALIVLWVIVTSLSARAHIIENSGNNVFRLMLMWSIFLPLDEYFSVSKSNKDLQASNDRDGESRDFKYFGFPAVAMFVQIALIYFAAGISKNDASWRHSLTAVYNAFSMGCFSKPMGTWLSQYFKFTQFLTISTLFVEILFPFFLIFEGRYLRLRSLAVLSFIVLQVSFYFCLDVGIFPFSMLVLTSIFVPSTWWRNFKVTTGATSTVENIIGEVSQRKTAQRGARNLVISLLLLFATWDMISSTFKGKYLVMPSWAEYITYSFRVDQRWWMFVQSEWRDNWIDVEAIKADGSSFDAWSWFRKSDDISFSTARPDDIQDLFSDQPWQNYINKLKKNSNLSKSFLYNLCERYNQEHPEDRAESMKLIYSYRKILGFDKFSEEKHKVFLKMNCPK